MKGFNKLSAILFFSILAPSLLPVAGYSETVAGSVYSGTSTTSVALGGVTVSVEVSGSQVASTTTDTFGNYNISHDEIVAGDIIVRFSIDGHVDTFGSFTAFSNETATLDTVTMVPDSTDTGTITGFVFDATTSDTRIADVTLTLRSGVNQTSGTTTASTATATDGTFTFLDIAAGTYALLAVKDGYSDVAKNVYCIGGVTKSFEHSMSPSAAEGVIRIILTWGETPTDLDSHLYTPEI
ncbi:MAG: hypothetical protein GY869_31110, partial [Planctomycetes bacterium]|nr:hypothetical protein [Planctomycetota bacterium]